MTTTQCDPATEARSSGAAAAALSRGVAAVAARGRAEVEVLEAALEFAGCHRVTTGARAASWGDVDPGGPSVLFGEGSVAIAGRGAPRVAEFAAMQWAAAVGVSHEAALAMLGDVLDLAVRLPRLWALVRQLRVPAHLARLAAQVSRDLDPAAAAHADALLCWQPGRLNPHRVGVLVHEARLYADPDRAVADHDEALARRCVEVDHDRGAPGTSRVQMLLDTADAEALEATVGRMASVMAALGHPGGTDVRRAHSVGVLADPQAALDLLAGDPGDPGRRVDPVYDPGHDPAVSVAAEVAHAPADPFRRASRAAGASIVFHVTDRDLLESGVLGRGGVARSRLGPVALDRLAGWLVGAGEITIKPVLDPDAISAVDVHDPPARMVEAVRLRDQTCVFPGCNRSCEGADLDHIEAYVPLEDGGPPGQTSVAGLAPLCRRHHRAKTFGGFSYRRLDDGSYEWVLPTGHTVTTDPHAPRPRRDPQRRA